MFYLFGKFDNTQRRDKCVTGMREKLRSGYLVWKTPIGYKNTNLGQTADKQNLVITPEGELLAQVFHWKAEKGISTVEIAKRLNHQGFKITDKKLFGLFQNPFCGTITSGLPEEV